jgi:aminoglycoside phosphotransferase (APT) family kinase protein
MPPILLVVTVPGVDAQLISRAFGLGQVNGELTPVQHTVSRTWRLDTSDDSYLVKELWPGEAPFWAGQVRDRMAFETRAGKAGISQPEPMLPSSPEAFAFASTIEGAGCYRVYRWLDRHPILSAPTDLWLVDTLARLHRLQPAPADQTHPRYYGVYPEARWTEWLRFGAEHNRAWAAPAADALTDILRLTETLRRNYKQAPDRVITHGDFMPSNVIYGEPGPVLIDWDSVGAESALHELGDTLYAFTDGDATRLREAAHAYLAKTGLETGGRQDELFDKTIGTRLAGLTELLIADSAGAELTGWKAMIGAREERVADEFRVLPSFAEDLRRLSRSTLSR